MKILFVNVLYSPYRGGGAEITLMNLVKGIKKNGHEVAVLTFWDKEDKEEIIDGILVYRVKIPNIYLPYGIHNRHFIQKVLWHLIDIYNPLARKIFYSKVKQYNPNIISIHNTQGWSSSIWDVVEELEIPTIQVLHDLYFVCPTSMFKDGSICKKQCLSCKIARVPYKLKSNKLQAVVGVSNFVLEKMLNHGYFTHVPIKKVIPNSRNLKDINFIKKIDSNYINLGFIGTLAPNKGIELLLKVFMELDKTKFRLIVAGSGKNDYEKYLKEKYKSESIIFLGKVDPKEFFEKIDVTIVPSIWYENFPGVIIESFAYGVPVVGSNIGGIPEMIIVNYNGMLFDPYKEGELKEKINDFGNDLLTWRGKSEIIKQSASHFLDYNKWINEWESLYRQIIDI